MKVKKILGALLASSISACLITVACATTDTTYNSFTYNGMGYTGFGTNSSVMRQNYGDITLRTHVESNYGSTAKQKEIYVNWQMAFTDTGEDFGVLTEAIAEDATEVEGNEVVPLGYRITTYAYHEVTYATGPNTSASVYVGNTESYLR